MTKISAQKIRPPKGCLLLGFRLPVWLYRFRMGWLMGKRMIYFEHIGRTSGIKRRSIVEIIRHDQEDDVYFVVSGYGEKADWFRNIMKTPKVFAQVGGRRFQADVERLSLERALEEFQDYARRNPKNLKYLGKLIGIKIEGTEKEIDQLSRILPVIAFKPIKTSELF